VGDDFSKEFVNNVAKGYRYVLLRSIRLPFFGDKGEESCIKIPEDLSRDPGVFQDFPDFSSNHRPTVVEEITGEAIWARSFAFGGVLECLAHFFDGEGSKKGCVLFLSHKGRHVPCDFNDCFTSVWNGFCEKVLEVSNQICFQICMGVKSLPLLCNEMRDLIGMSSLDGSPMEEFSIAFSFLEPLNPRLLFP